MTTELKTLCFMISRRKKIMVFADYVSHLLAKIWCLTIKGTMWKVLK